MQISEVSADESKILYEMAIVWLRSYRDMYEMIPNQKHMVAVGTGICEIFVRAFEENISNPKRVREGDW